MWYCFNPLKMLRLALDTTQQGINRNMLWIGLMPPWQEPTFYLQLTFRILCCSLSMDTCLFSLTTSCSAVAICGGATQVQEGVLLKNDQKQENSHQIWQHLALKSERAYGGRGPGKRAPRTDNAKGALWCPGSAGAIVFERRAFRASASGIQETENGPVLPRAN